MKVLIPTDFSNYSEATIICAINELKKIDCEVILMHIIQFDPEMIDMFAGVTFEKARDELTQNAKKKLDEIVEMFRSAGIDARYIEPYIGDPVVEIAKKAEEEKVGLIMIGARGKGLSRKIKAVMGSVSEGVVELSNVPVLVTKFEVEGGVCKTAEPLFDRVLYSFDFSKQSEELFYYLKRFPINELVALHVVETEELDLDFMERIKKEYPDAKIVLKAGKAGKTIIETANSLGATLIALGAGMNRLGSVASNVIRNSNKSVLVYK